MPEQLSTKPAGASEVRAILGPLDDAVISRILATGATAADVRAHRFPGPEHCFGIN